MRSQSVTPRQKQPGGAWRFAMPLSPYCGRSRAVVRDRMSSACRSLPPKVLHAERDLEWFALARRGFQSLQLSSRVLGKMQALGASVHRLRLCSGLSWVNLRWITPSAPGDMCVCANAGHRCDLARLPWGARVVIKLAPVPTEMLLQWQGSNDLATDRVAAGAHVEHQAYRRSLLARTLLGWRPMGLLADHRRASHCAWERLPIGRW
jgi:hypothetical protein